MPDAPKITADRLNAITSAWEELAPASSFGDMTLVQFEASVKPSRDIRATINDLETKLSDALNVRTAVDKVSNARADLVVNGVIGSTAYGPDSSLYEKMGYVRKSERKSGLTRKSKTAPPK